MNPGSTKGDLFLPKPHSGEPPFLHNSVPTEGDMLMPNPLSGEPPLLHYCCYYRRKLVDAQAPFRGATVSSLSSLLQKVSFGARALFWGPSVSALLLLLQEKIV